jgi:Cd2+/Zn2+-exporting ATPase
LKAAGERMTEMKHQKQLIRILLSGAGLVLAALLPLEAIPRLIAFLAVYLLIGWDILWRAAVNIAHGQVFDENFLMAIATVGAFAVGDYPEGVAVMLFYQVGELFQSYAVGKSRKSISSLMDIRPDYANVERGGELVQVDPDEVEVGDCIVINPGERIPLDGRILAGVSSLDTSALTGESVPRDAEPGDEVISGCINLTGRLTVEVSRVYGESTVAKILDLVENASSKKAKAENFITKFARYYTPAVVIAAVLLAVVPPLFLPGYPFGEWVTRALTFLVISCPCALVISVPMSFFGGIGGASKAGVLIKGSSYLEALADTEMVVFDKTGTLTKGSFAVTGVHSTGMDDRALLELAAYAESSSSHPIAQSILRAYGGAVDRSRVERVEELAGHGVRAVIDGRAILAGNRRLMESEGIAFDSGQEAGTVVHLAVDGVYAGRLVIEDEIKPDAAGAIALLKENHVRRTVMLTGDSDAVGQRVAKQVGIDQAYTGLLPADKVERMEELLTEKSSRGKLAFVGDGINDAPVLARADIGIAMGGLGSDAAIEAADVVIMTDEPSKLAAAIRISRKTLRIVRQNIVFALGVKAVILLLGALGYANMWSAVFADVGVSVLAIMNAIRALQVEKIVSD